MSQAPDPNEETEMNGKRWMMFSTLALLALAASATADPVVWEVNGHCYEAIETGGGLDWFECRDLAVTYGGHLATIESAEENAFVYSLVQDRPEFWFVDGAGNTEGPYLGGFQEEDASEPAGDWQWVTGETWAYTNWKWGEPNNSGGNEDALVFFEHGDQTQSPPYGAATWNDVGLTSTEIRGFILEGMCTVPGEAATWSTLKALYR